MRKSAAFFGTYTASLFILSLVSLQAAEERPTPTPVPLSPLQKGFVQYLSAAEEFNKDKTSSQDREERLKEFHELWRERLMKELGRSSADDPGVERMLVELRSMNVALGDFKSALLISADLQKKASTPQAKLDALVASENIMVLSGSKLPEVVEKGAALAILEELSSQLANAKDLKVQADTLNGMGDIYRRYGEPDLAIAKYCESASTIGRSSADGKLGVHFADVILLKAVDTDSQAGGTHLPELQKQLMGVEGGAYEPGFRLFKIAQSVDPKEGEKFAQFLEANLNSVPVDSWTPFLVKQVGEVYFENGDYSKAIEYIGKFLSSDFKSFQPVRPSLNDPAKFIREALNTFGTSLKMVGDRESKTEVDNLVKVMEAKWKDFENQQQSH